VLSRHLAELMPEGARVLDVGCGDGRIAASMQRSRADLAITGMDIAVRPDALIPVQEFDGATIPFDDNAADVVMLVDVLHHLDEPEVLLAEAVRVAESAVVLKDVTALGLLAEPTLRFMDWFGNARHGVPLPYTFWSQEEWRHTFSDLGLSVDAETWSLGLYTWPWRLLFERRMHFIVRLVRQGRDRSA
jgi:SAM-dependent methyltransferase